MLKHTFYIIFYIKGVKAVKEQLINEIVTEMKIALDNNQLLMLFNTLTKCLDDVEISAKETALSTNFADNEKYLQIYLTVKELSGLQPKTLDTYSYHIKKFFEETGCDVPRCTTNTIRKYLNDMQRKTSNTTVDNTRRYLNGFFQFLENERYIESNPLKKIPKIKEEQKVQKFWDDMAIETLRDNCVNKRELALIDLLLSTGLRISEVPKIKLSDIDWEKRLILIHGKGNKQRIVPFSIRAKKHLHEYLLERGINTSIYLFSRTRKPYDKEPTKSMINDIFDEIRNRAGINDITIHGLRRWVACHMDECGAEATVIQDMFGHSSFNTTKRYYLNKNITNMSHTHHLCAV